MSLPDSSTTVLGVDGALALVLTIENQTTFHSEAKRRADDDVLLIYTAGMPWPAERAMYERLLAGTPVMHWGDVDEGGFLIAANVAEAARPAGHVLQRYRMSPAEIPEGRRRPVAGGQAERMRAFAAKAVGLSWQLPLPSRSLPRSKRFWIESQLGEQVVSNPDRSLNLEVVQGSGGAVSLSESGSCPWPARRQWQLPFRRLCCSHQPPLRSVCDGTNRTGCGEYSQRTYQPQRCLPASSYRIHPGVAIASTRSWCLKMPQDGLYSVAHSPDRGFGSL